MQTSLGWLSISTLWRIVRTSLRIREKRLLLPSCRPSVYLAVCLSVCPSAQHGSHWTDGRKIWYWGLLWKSGQKIQISLKSDKYIGHFAWRPKYVLLFPATLNRHKALSSTEMVSGCQSVRQSVRLSACISAAATGWISMKWIIMFIIVQ